MENLPTFYKKQGGGEIQCRYSPAAEGETKSGEENCTNSMFLEIAKDSERNLCVLVQGEIISCIIKK